MGKSFNMSTWFSCAIGRTAVTAMIVATMSLSACDMSSSEPVYSSVGVEAFNYTSYNLDHFVVRDQYGNKASGGGDLMPGSGAGSVSCCYALKGTDFTVDWDVYDADAAQKQIDAQQDISVIRKTARVHMPPAEVKGKPGQNVLALHFYPDDHVEFEFRDDLQGARISYAKVDEWFQRTYGKAANPDNLDDAKSFRRTVRVAADGWKKYGLTSEKDLEQYVYYALIVNPRFDEYPAVQKILVETKGKPDAFGDAMRKLSPATVDEIKRFRPEQKEEVRG